MQKVFMVNKRMSEEKKKCLQVYHKRTTIKTYSFGIITEANYFESGKKNK